MKQKTGYGNASLVCSIISLVLWFMPYFGLPLAILAVIFGTKQNKESPTGVATAGYVIGIISIVINSVVGIFALLVLLLMPQMFR